MPKDEWGVKRLCPSCNNRFYDLGNDPMTCPNCSAVFSVADLTASDGGAKAAERIAEKASAGTAAEDADDLVLDDDADVDIDDELLEDDDDDTVSLDEIADVSSGDDED